MEIVLFPHPALRWKSKPVTEINAQLRSVVAEMFELMYAASGIGLAANQVGLPYQLFIVNPMGDPAEKDQEHVFINPEITFRKGSVEGEEGCLSLPQLYGQVRRAEQIVVEAYDLRGEAFEMTLDELPARVVQHEADHLQGILFPDRLSEAGKREIEPKLADFESTFKKQQELGSIPSDREIEQALRSLESI